MSGTNDSNPFGKIRKWLGSTGMPKKISAAQEHLQDKAPDVTVVRTPQQKMMRKVVKI